MEFLTGIWATLVKIWWALLPSKLRPTDLTMKARAGSERFAEQVRFDRFARIVRWIVHILVVAAIVVLLWYINRSYDLERVLRSPLRPLHAYWLPLLFLTGYVLFWLGWWALSLLTPEPDSADFPDIDEAWAEALKALEESSIDPAEAPLFLVIGRPARSTEDLFAAAQWPLQVRHVPRRADAPLHIYATREAIFVTCAGASLMGRAAELLSEETKKIEPPPPMESTGPPAEDASAPPSEVAVEPNSSGPGLLLLEPETATTTTARRLTLSRNAEETDRLTARLRYLCRLIARRREPFCAANGILLLVPLAAASDAENAEEAAALCQGDLIAARESLRVRCPVVVVLCDAEKLPGFQEFLQRVPDERPRQQALGVRFPLRPRLDAAEIPAMIENGLRWAAQSYLPAQAFHLLRSETAGANGSDGSFEANARLVTMIGELLLRQPHLSRILTEGVLAAAEGTPLLGGCFFAATGPDGAREQGFVHAVLRQMLEGQNAVAWTEAALAEERDYRRLARYTTTAVVAAGLFLIWLVFLVWYR